MNNKYKYLMVLLTLALVLFSSCSNKLGYGVLLWSIDEPPILSGTVLPVYIRSNIEKVWIVGIPEHLVELNGSDKIEVPISHLEFVGSRRKAENWAEEFSEFALVYAENLQDGLPIRENTDNNARRVYRLRQGEIIKVLGVAGGNPPIGGTGDPLPGDWLSVLTSEGVTGFCFSFRLRLYNQDDHAVHNPDDLDRETIIDPNLEIVLSRVWSTESYAEMLATRQINLQALERNYRFEPGHETGVARVILPEFERRFNYQRITSDGDRSWRFDGTTLHMSLRSDTSLVVQFTDTNGLRRVSQFVALPTSVNDLIVQERAHRNRLLTAMYNHGPVFTSNNYGTLTLTSSGDFTWTGYDLLVPQLFPAETSGIGRINMDIYISPTFGDRYNGAFSLVFTDIRTNNTFYFMYGFDEQGLRLEVVPANYIEDVTVMRRSPSPMVLYFFRNTAQ
jgi:hypothetical protein